jgi:DnaJ like chaperone protein
MSWWGMFIGGMLGLQLGGPLGAILGAVAGHKLTGDEDDQGKGIGSSGQPAQERAQLAFYSSVFSTMGHICKADGHVDQNEIILARQVMQQLGLSTAQQQMAMRMFEEGKKPQFPLHDVINQLKQEIGYQPNLYRMFLEIEIMAAYADNVMHPAERRLLLEISRLLNISASEFEHLCASINSARGGNATPSVEDAYSVLGIDETASDHEVKLAYRRLTSQHHPDKLVAKGLPEEMMKLAAKRTHEIRQAYEKIKQTRGSR